MADISSAADYTRLLEDCLGAWNRADAGEVASHYSERLDYRDPNVPEGIKTNADFQRYLRVLFRKWPSQEWSPDEVLSHERPGSFSVCYRFRFGNGKREVRGLGMDRIEFEGDKIRLNWVYLNAEGGGMRLSGHE
ncbi:MAG: nuclear transport factor 2 family protein [Elusimicrobiota bacterium]